MRLNMDDYSDRNEILILLVHCGYELEDAKKWFDENMSHQLFKMEKCRKELAKLFLKRIKNLDNFVGGKLIKQMKIKDLQNDLQTLDICTGIRYNGKDLRFG